MVLDKFNMVDMEGVDIIEDQGVEIPGLYQKLVESIAQCRYQCLYNWKSGGVNIPPSFVELVADPDNGNILISTGIYVTPEDVITTAALDAGAVTYDPTETYQSGTVGYELSQQKNHIDQLDNKVVTDITVTGADVTIVAEANKRYLCGTVSTIAVTPCETGVFDFIFTSGSTAAILTIPNTVKWQDASFDPSALDADTIYEISIADGILGLVASWT